MNSWCGNCYHADPSDLKPGLYCEDCFEKHREEFRKGEINMMRTVNNNVIVRKENRTSRSGIVIGTTESIGVVVEGNINCKPGDVIVYKDSFKFSWNGEKYESVEPRDVVAILGEEE